MRALLFLLLALLLAAPAGAAVVHCHDPARGVVQPMDAHECRGRIVEPAEAAALKAAFEEARRVAMRRRMAISALRLDSAGTGFAVAPGGVTLTTAHGVAGCDALAARGPDGAPRRARLLRVDRAADLALVLADPPARKTARFAALPPVDGTALALIGYPLEGMIRLRASNTPVTVDYTVAHPSRDGLTGIRGDVRRGHSGGPLLDSRGDVVGLLSEKVDSVEAFRRNGTLVRHMGVFAPGAALRAFLRESGVAVPDQAVPGGAPTLAHARDFTLRIDCLKARAPR